jgi:hypothetical protein
MSLSCNITHRELDIPTRTYVETTRKGVIVPQGSNSTGFPLANLAKYANTLFTATIEEGDQVTHADGTNYEVPNITPYWVGDRFEFYVCELIETQSVTLKTLTLGAQDTVTGWYAESYANTTITMNIAVKGSSHIQTVLGYHNKYEYSGLTSAIVHVGGQITDAYGDTYKIIQVTSYPTKRLTAFNYSVCALIKTEYANRPTTSGTWHLDSETLKTDPRWRHKDYLDDYLTAGNLKEDNGATNASYITCFNDDELPISQIFLTKAVDLVFSVGKENAVPKQNAFHYPYAFEESVPITVCAVDKAGITATNLIEQAEQEIRRIVSTYPLGSIREISSSKPAEIDLGETKLCTQTVTISYTRVNDDYTPTYPVFDYGIAFIYEGDRLAGGAEGTWTESGGGTTVVNSENNLEVAGDSTVTTVTAGTNLQLNTTTYGKCRIRYKTASGATLTVTTDDETLLSAVSSATWTVANITLTGGNMLDHFTIHNASHAGTAYVDFIEIYTGTYILPNCTVIEPPVMVNDALIDIPGRVGSVNQVLGSQSMEVTMEADLDMEPAALTWKRPQTTAGKTDANNQDVLLELNHRGSFYENWTWLDIGNPAMQFKARLIEMHPSYTGEAGKVRLVWREYRHGGASGETASERFGLSL